MNRFFYILAWLILSLTIGHTDTIFLKSGATSSGKIIVFDGQKLIFQMRLDDSGTAELTYDVALIDKIRVERTSEENKILANPSASFPDLEALWKKRQIYLSLPESDAGEIGQKYAQALLDQRKVTRARTALHLCEILEKSDWSIERRNAVKSLRLQALIQMGQADKAMIEAEKVTSLDTANTAAMIDAKFVLAQGAEQKLKVLESKNPRWNEVRAKRTEHTALLQQALDHYLFPVVLFADQSPSCARGLYHAAELALRNQLNDQAAIWVQEIIEYFPDPHYLPRAQNLAQRLESKPKITKE